MQQRNTDATVLHMQETAPAVSRPLIRLKTSWIQECERLGLRSDSQRASAFGVNRTTLNLIQNNRRSPSNEFIAGVMSYMAPRRVRFEDVFTWEPAA